jgi:hypothetical protein
MGGGPIQQSPHGPGCFLFGIRHSRSTIAVVRKGEQSAPLTTFSRRRCERLGCSGRRCSSGTR